VGRLDRRGDPHSHRRRATEVRAQNGQHVIMAHYPTERSSDLSLDSFFSQLLRHNAENGEEDGKPAMRDPASVLALGEGGPIPRSLSEGQLQLLSVDDSQSGALGDNAGERFRSHSMMFADPVCMPRVDDDADRDEQAPRGLSPFTANFAEEPESEDDADSVVSSEPPATDDEAREFVKELNHELDAPSGRNRSALTACVGARRDITRDFAVRRPKGVKLDFKQVEAIEPTLKFLRDKQVASKLDGHLWLNADVFAGPGNLMSPFDAKKFVKLCAEGCPEAVLSLSWGSSVISTTRLYTREMVDSMVGLCMSPMVPRKVSDDGGVDRYLTPAAVCRHITFAVAADYALGSAASLRRLLSCVPGSSLTLFSGVGSVGVTPAYVHQLIGAFGKANLFLDVKLVKSWRSCTSAGCSLQ